MYSLTWRMEMDIETFNVGKELNSFGQNRHNQKVVIEDLCYGSGLFLML